MTPSSLESLLVGIHRKGASLFRKYACPLVLATAVALPSPALADTFRVCTDAKSCYRQGAALYQQGNYQEALQFFQESYKGTTDRTVRSTLLYNIANTHANLRQPQLATEYLTLYVAENPSERGTIAPMLEALAIYSQGLDSYDHKNYAVAVEKFKQVYGRVAKTESLRVTVLHDLAESYEQLGRYDLAAEYYTLYLNDSGHRAQDKKSIEAKMAVWSAKAPSPRSQAEPEHHSLPEPVLMEKPKEEKSFLWQHPWSTGSASVSAAALIGGMVAGYMARSKFNELNNSCAPGCSERDIDTVATQSSIANGLFILADVTAGAASGLYWWESSQQQQTSSRSIHMTPMGVGGEF